MTNPPQFRRSLELDSIAWSDIHLIYLFACYLLKPRQPRGITVAHDSHVKCNVNLVFSCNITDCLRLPAQITPGSPSAGPPPPTTQRSSTGSLRPGCTASACTPTTASAARIPTTRAGRIYARYAQKYEKSERAIANLSKDVCQRDCDSQSSPTVLHLKSWDRPVVEV